MGYVYGTAEIDGVIRENLKVIGGPKPEEGEYPTTVRECDDNTIADRCRIDRHYLTAEDENGTEYDFYAINEYYRYIDYTKMLDKTKAATEITFVTLVETGGIDGTTAGEHKNLFEEWQAGVSYKVGQHRRYGEKLYRYVQQHTSQTGWKPDKTASLWPVATSPVGEWPEWSQPLGAHDAHVKGVKVSHNGKHWVSDVGTNV